MDSFNKTDFDARFHAYALAERPSLKALLPAKIIRLIPRCEIGKCRAGS
jgi:hypothetical protein